MMKSVPIPMVENDKPFVDRLYLLSDYDIIKPSSTIDIGWCKYLDPTCKSNLDP